MVDRIKALLETRQLTPTQFADLIGTARPIISHILSGRNKPSLEVVQRILAALPELSMAWLLNGTEPMYNDDSATDSAVALSPVEFPGSAAPAKELLPVAAPLPPPAPATQPSPPAPKVATASSTGKKELFSTAEAGGQPSPSIRRFTPPTAQPLLSLPAQPEPAISVSEPAPDPPLATDGQPGPVAPAPPAPVGAAAPEASAAATALLAGSEKPIRRIVIFYRDGSFADYQPE